MNLIYKIKKIRKKEIKNNPSISSYWENEENDRLAILLLKNPLPIFLGLFLVSFFFVSTFFWSLFIKQICFY